MKTAVLLGFTAFALHAADLKLGIVGTDTSHATAFSQLLNDPANAGHVAGARVVAAYKGGSPDVESSRTRIDKFAQELSAKWGVQFYDSIPEMCRNVDAVLLLSVDGRVHLEQARQIIAARKPMFIDKPLASTLAAAREIARLAQAASVPWFSASSMRFTEILGQRKPGVLGAETWGPGPLEPHHQLDLSWYAIHPIEMLFTIMGQGCEEVTRTHAEDADVVVGRWRGGRIGVVRALRPYGNYGAVVYSKEGKNQKAAVFDDVKGGYASLVREIVKFFDTRTPPVSNAETLEIWEFLDAAQRSLEEGGKPVRLNSAGASSDHATHQ